MPGVPGPGDAAVHPVQYNITATGSHKPVTSTQRNIVSRSSDAPQYLNDVLKYIFDTVVATGCYGGQAADPEWAGYRPLAAGPGHLS